MKARLPDVLRVAGDRAASLTPDERACLRKILILRRYRSLITPRKFLEHIPPGLDADRAIAALKDLESRGILEFRHQSAYGLSGELLMML